MFDELSSPPSGLPQTTSSLPSLLGLPEERLTHMAVDEHLARWWHNYLNYAADLTSLVIRKVV